MKTPILYLVLLFLAFSKPLLSQELDGKFNNNPGISSGLGPVITNVLIVNDTCKGPLIKLTVQSNTSCNYHWSDGSFFSSISPKNAGIYSVTITDTNGNSVTGGPYEIKDYPIYPYYNNIQIMGDCKNQTNGSIHFIGAGPTDIYYWSQDPNLHSNEANKLAVGIYKVFITDKTGTCKTPITSYEVHDNTPYIKNIEIGGISPCVKWPQTSGYINFDLVFYYKYNPISPSDPNYDDGPYIFNKDSKGINYYWTYGDNDPYGLIKGLPDHGLQKYYIIGYQDCTVDTALYIPILANLTSNILTSFPDKETHIYSANTQVKGGQAPYTYKWSDGNTQKSRNDLLAGKSYHVTVTDIYGCSSSNNVYVKKLKGENEVNFVNKGDNIEIRTDSELASENRYTYKLFDILGKSYIIKESDKTKSQWQLNTTNLAKGMYYLTAQYEDVIQTFPFVILKN